MARPLTTRVKLTKVQMITDLGDDIDTMNALVSEEMKAALPLNVPIEIGLGVADNWLDAH